MSELWSAIHARFDSQGLPAVAAIAHKLWHYWILPDRDIATQVQEIKNMAIKLKSLRYPLSKEFQTIAILTALPSKWNTIHDIILNKTGKFSLQATIDALLEHETVLKHDQENALISSQSSKLKLFFSNPDSKGTEGPTCSNCKRPGHTVDHCWAKGGGAEGKGPKWKQSKGNSKGKGKKTGSAKVANDNRSLSPPPAVYITHAEALMSKDTSDPRETYFYLDLAASNHICHTQDYFSSYRKLGSPRRIKTANGYSNAIGIGDITVCTYLNGKS